MTIDGHTTCPHCKAIATSSICTICGKSSFQEVAAPPEKIQARWWEELDRGKTARQAATVLGLMTVAAIAAFVLTRTPPPPDPVALPAPTPTSSTVAPSTDQSPSIENRNDRAPRRGAPLESVGARREVGLGLSPWETAPPVNFVTGQFLDFDADYSADIARVDKILDAFPVGASLLPLEVPELVTFGGSIDLVLTESTQPFAARLIESEGTVVGELWVIASAGSDDGDDYLAAAASRWDIAAALDQFSPEVGVRIWKLAEDETVAMWSAPLDARSLLLIQLPASLGPTVLTDALAAWRLELVD